MNQNEKYEEDTEWLVTETEVTEEHTTVKYGVSIYNTFAKLTSFGSESSTGSPIP